MPDALYEKHKDTLKKARKTIASREYWSPYPESPRAYGEDAPAAGEEAFESRLGKRFALDQAADSWSAGSEKSAYGRHLEVTYPVTGVAALLDNATAAGEGWGRAPVKHRSGVCMEILDRLSKNSFEMAYPEWPARYLRSIRDDLLPWSGY